MEERNALKKEVETKNQEVQEKVRTITQVKKIGRRYKTQYDELKVQHDKVRVCSPKFQGCIVQTVLLSDGVKPLYMYADWIHITLTRHFIQMVAETASGPAQAEEARQASVQELQSLRDSLNQAEAKTRDQEAQLENLNKVKHWTFNAKILIVSFLYIWNMCSL